LLFVESSNQPGAAPTDYVQVPGSPQGGGSPGSSTGLGLECFWKRAGVSESAPTVDDRGTHTYAVIAGFRGCPTTGNPWDITPVGGSDTAASDTSLSIPGGTTTLDNVLVVQAAVHRVDQLGANFSAWANTSLTNLTERFDNSTDISEGGGIAVVTGGKATAGAFGATTATLTAASTDAFITIALKAA
jgi:hypothetical protein